MTLEQRGRNVLAWLIGVCFPVQKKTPEQLRQEWQKGGIRKVLLIRPNQGLGDLLLATPVLRALKHLQPEPELHFLSEAYNVLSVLTNTRITRHWVWDKKGMRSSWRLVSFLRGIRRERFDLAIILTSNIPSFTTFLFARMTGATVLACSTEPFYGGANWSRTLAHVEIPLPPEDSPEAAKFMAIVKPLGVSVDYTPEFNVSPEAVQRAAERWRQWVFPAGNRKVGLFFGGNPDRPDRLWPAETWGRLAAYVEAEPTFSLVAIVPPESLRSGTRALERGVFDQARPYLKRSPPQFSDPDLEAVAAFLKGLDLFVCVDGGLFHVAVAAGVRTLGLMFITDPARWVPPVPWVFCLKTDRPDQLSSETVFQKIQEILRPH
ncbi:MAG: glycosyltransferase family 9 protein [Elusimicrobiota bacterium]